MLIGLKISENIMKSKLFKENNVNHMYSFAHPFKEL